MNLFADYIRVWLKCNAFSKEKKMKDEEIIKALGMCNAENCDNRICPYGTYGEDIFLCTPKLTEDALDLIKRQQAEIERLKNNIQ